MLRRIVMTGVSRGLGRALTEAFLDAGHTVFGCARNADAIAELNARAAGGESRFHSVDIANATAVQEWADDVLNAGPPPDLLINNAAFMNTPTELWKVSETDWKHTVDINILGTANTIRSFVPAMVAQQRGVIVNLSSGWGRSTSPEVGPYCASKWAIEGLTKALAQELPDGMAAVPLSPGVINTDMLQKAWGADAAQFDGTATWVKKAAPFVLHLTAEHNGQSLQIG